MTTPAAVPTEEERAKAFELSEMPPRTNTALIAQALATARASARSAALENAELHELTDAACKVATKLGLEITIRVKEKRAKKGA